MFEFRRHHVHVGCTAALLLAASAFAQNPQVPNEYRDLYDSLDTQLTAFQNTLNSQWDGKKSAAIFSAELLSANANNGLKLLTPQARARYLQELDRLQAMGVQAVVIPIGFPILYQPFYDFNRDPQDYQAFIEYYKQLVAEVHARNLKLIVETSVLFPSADYSGNSGFNLAGYYATLNTLDALTNARAANAINILREVQPDFLNLGSEPDTQATNTRQPSLNIPSVYGRYIANMLAQINAAGVRKPITPIGAGIGTWLANGNDFIDAIAGTDLDYIDLHVYPVNHDYLMNVIAYADRARNSGKPVAISEAWLLKERDSELGKLDAATDSTVYSRDAWSFWAPLDQKFLTALAGFSNWKNLRYFSAFWSRYFWSYLDYNTTQGLGPDALTARATDAAANALTANQTTGTYGLYKQAAAPSLTVVSAAGYGAILQSSNSIVSLFGLGLATGIDQATDPLTLPQDLRSTSVTITDSSNKTTRMGLYFVSTGQINAVIPPGLPPGPATIQVQVNNVTVALSAVTIAPVAPSFFTMNQNGQGVPAASVVTNTSDSRQIRDNAFLCPGGAGTCTPKPISLGGSGDSVALELYGTGFRSRTSLGNVVATVGTTVVPVLYAGAQSQYAGFDEVVVSLPPSLAGAGTVNLTVTVDGVNSNVVSIAIQ